MWPCTVTKTGDCLPRWQHNTTASRTRSPWLQCSTGIAAAAHFAPPFPAKGACCRPNHLLACIHQRRLPRPYLAIIVVSSSSSALPLPPSPTASATATPSVIPDQPSGLVCSIAAAGRTTATSCAAPTAAFTCYTHPRSYLAATLVLSMTTGARASGSGGGAEPVVGRPTDTLKAS